MRLSILAATLALLAACGGSSGAFHCETSEQCNLRPGGQCFTSPDGPAACGYPESDCPSGFVYDDGGGPLTGVCVGGDTPDAAAPDAHVDGGTTIDAAPGVCVDRIAFVTDRNGRSTDDIYTMPPTGSPQTPLTTHARIDTSPEWSPTGAHVAFVSERTGDKEIWVADANGGGLVNVSNDGDLTTEDRDPAWSPDGTRLAFVSLRNGREQVFTVNRDGTDLRPVSSPAYQGGSPAWSPDGMRIAYRSAQGGTWFQVYVMDADGSDQRAITSAGVVRDRPQWSPDGTRVLFVGGTFATTDVFTVLVDGSGPDSDLRNLSNHSAVDHQATWSPDGSRVLFVSTRDGNDEVYVVPANGGAVGRVTEDPARDITPRWSPDGASIAWMSDRTGDNEIWLTSIGGQPLNLSQQAGARDDAPAWLACPRR